jgi:hypothetical protein
MLQNVKLTISLKWLLWISILTSTTAMMKILAAMERTKDHRDLLVRVSGRARPAANVIKLFMSIINGFS